MLFSRELARVGGVSLFTVTCRHEPRRARQDEVAKRAALVFVRSGCFTRTVRGVTALMDATSAYAVASGSEQRYGHPDGHGDDCTYLTLDDDLLDQVGCDPAAPPADPAPTSPATDLAHRRLLAVAGRPGSADAVFEQAVALAADTIAALRQQPTRHGMTDTRRAHLALVDAVRQALTAEPALSLVDLARCVSVSPHHLSRIFRASTGTTVTAYRTRLRVRAALERLGQGEHDLSGLASALGFADHSHMTRVLRQETGSSPSQLRQLLAPTTGGR